MPLRERFSEIYSTQEWVGGGSGEGSATEHVVGYAALVSHLVRRRRIRSVVDLGCGDGRVAEAIDFGRARYLGLDVVPEVVAADQRRLGSRRMRFRAIEDESEVGSADLLLVKDVLQHWSIPRVQAFRPRLDGFRYALVTNCIGLDGEPRNTDVPDGGFRGLDLNAEPFGWGLPVLLSFTNVDAGADLRWVKQVLLFDGEAPRQQPAAV